MINPTQRADALTQDEMNYETNEAAAAGLRDVSAARVRGEGGLFWLFFPSRYISNITEILRQIRAAFYASAVDCCDKTTSPGMIKCILCSSILFEWRMILLKERLQPFKSEYVTFGKKLYCATESKELFYLSEAIIHGKLKYSNNAD